jgi:hypothetical protein
VSPRYRHFTGVLIIAALAIAAFWAERGHADVPLGRYTISNGMVVDTKTLLTWEQTFPQIMYDWEGAKGYCASLGSGWRLPSVKELQTLVDRTKVNPAIDLETFPKTPSTFFWTSSPVAASPTDAWNVDFTKGYSGSSATTTPHQVRCVR